MTLPASSTDSEPGGSGDRGYLEIYKLTVEMADRVSARRTNANNFFLALNAAMVTVVGLIRPVPLANPPSATPYDALPVLLTAGAGLALSAAWWLSLRSYRDLNRAKFDVITKMEAQLPTQPFANEWQELKKDEVSWWRGRYTEQGTVERVVPVVFAFLYLAALVSSIWRP